MFGRGLAEWSVLANHEDLRSTRHSLPEPRLQDPLLSAEYAEVRRVCQPSVAYAVILIHM
jgi:hypothetical protein